MENHELNDFLTRKLSVENMELREPDPLLVFEARHAVMSRKKKMHEPHFLMNLWQLFQPQLKFYHVGICALLITTGIFYTTNNGEGNNGQYFINSSDASLSIKNNTISVISSTMLTSIPTLRN